MSDIAERLDLSTVSVSKALRDHSDIAEATRARVKEMAREMGYVPNLVARSLSSKQSNTLGVVVPKVAHTFFASALDGIHEVAAARGYEIILAVSRENADTERRHLETLLSMRVDGLLVSASQGTPARSPYALAKNMGVPLVFFDRAVEPFADEFGFGRVTVDDRGGARAAVAHVLTQGRRRVAHLAGYAHVGIGRERRAGYEEALRAAGVPVKKEWIVEGGFSERYGYEGMKKIIAQSGQAEDERPDALFAATFPVGLGALDALREVAPGLLERVQMITFGNHQLNRHLARPFVCVRQREKVLGRRAAAMLLDEIAASASKDGAPEKPRHVVLPTRLVRLGDYTEVPAYLRAGASEA